MNYCLIDEGIVVDGPKPLPTNWRNISNLPSLSDVELKVLNWLPAVYTILEFDPSTQKRLSDTYTIASDKVDIVYNFVDKTEEEIAADEAAASAAVVLEDMESISYIRTFLKAKFEEDALFPDELK